MKGITIKTQKRLKKFFIFCVMPVYLQKIFLTTHANSGFMDRSLIVDIRLATVTNRIKKVYE